LELVEQQARVGPVQLLARWLVLREQLACEHQQVVELEGPMRLALACCADHVGSDEAQQAIEHVVGAPGNDPAGRAANRNDHLADRHRVAAPGAPLPRTPRTPLPVARRGNATNVVQLGERIGERDQRVRYGKHLVADPQEQGIGAVGTRRHRRAKLVDSSVERREVHRRERRRLAVEDRAYPVPAVGQHGADLLQRRLAGICGLERDAEGVCAKEQIAVGRVGVQPVDEAHPALLGRKLRRDLVEDGDARREPRQSWSARTGHEARTRATW
jgi:hypothetical protein